MNPDESNLYDNGVQAQSIVPVIEIQQPIAQKNRSSKSIAFILIAIILTLIVIGLVFAQIVNNKSLSVDVQNAASNNQTQTKPKEAEQVFINPIDGSKTEIGESDYYVVAIGDLEYYGRVSKINSDYIRMLPTVYRATTGDDLIFTGNEIHKPEPATYFRISNITRFQNLTDVTIIEAIKATGVSFSDAFPSDDINKYIDTDQSQAFFFSDGLKFFAKTDNLDGNFLATSGNVYKLQTNSTSGDFNSDGSLFLADLDQYDSLRSTDLLYWQNMKSDSLITKSILEYEARQ